MIKVMYRDRDIKLKVVTIKKYFKQKLKKLFDTRTGNRSNHGFINRVT
jgi:hypothetical protein